MIWTPGVAIPWPQDEGTLPILMAPGTVPKYISYAVWRSTPIAGHSTQRHTQGSAARGPSYHYFVVFAYPRRTCQTQTRLSKELVTRSSFSAMQTMSVMVLTCSGRRWMRLAPAAMSLIWAREREGGRQAAKEQLTTSTKYRGS